MIKLKSIFCIVLTLFLISSYVVKAQTFEPVCQVGSVSGFCRHFAYTPVVSTPSLDSIYNFGTYDKPFDINSLWNIRPRQVALGTSVIPASTYYPLIGTGQYSTTAFEAKPSDLPVTVYPQDGLTGVWDADSQTSVPFITIPHWPTDTVPASGSDGHADIVDGKNNVIHSFWQLKMVNGRWTANQYAWSRLNGRGWGDGVHYFQGARAAGITSMAGLIRKNEINDGASQYYHALAMSMTFNGMSGTQQYVFPATSGDRTFRENSGSFPTGALIMLPPNYDESRITSPDLLKVVKTLKTYGAYVVDRNHGTPFYIYVENGTDFNLHKGGWNSAVGEELQRIRQELRQVMYAKDWVNIKGEPVTNLEPLGVLHMRGSWMPLNGGTRPRYDSMLQGVVFGATDKPYTFEAESGKSISHVNWAQPVKGKMYEFKVQSTNGGKAYFRFWGANGELFNSKPLGNGETFRFIWPIADGASILGVISGVGSKSTVKATLKPVE